MDVRRLTETAFQATFTAPMHEVTGEEGEIVDIWEYVECVPLEDLDGLAQAPEVVSHVWRDAYDRYDHVLLPLTRTNVFLVIVVDLKNRCVYGHHVLDLGALYGQPSDEPQRG